MTSRRVSPSQRREIVRRANGCCEYCLSQARFSTQAFSVEHIFPRSRGGQSSLENLGLSCPGCNTHKYNKTHSPDPLALEVAPLFHPRQQKWTDHFMWSLDYSKVVGITPTGRATVAA